MFGAAPPKPSAAETARLRLEARRSLDRFVGLSAALYLAPWAIYYARQFLEA